MEWKVEILFLQFFIDFSKQLANLNEISKCFKFNYYWSNEKNLASLSFKS